jgi:hypothetical protein
MLRTEIRNFARASRQKKEMSRLRFVIATLFLTGLGVDFFRLTDAAAPRRPLVWH